MYGKNHDGTNLGIITDDSCEFSKTFGTSSLESLT